MLSTAVTNRWLARLFRCYPVTLVVLAPYLLFVLPSAVVFQNPNLGFLVRAIGLALAGSALVETVALPLRATSVGWAARAAMANNHPWLYRVAAAVATTSIVADLAGALAGRGTVFTQVAGRLPDSPLAHLTALVSGWSTLAVALLIAVSLGGRASRRAVTAWLLALILTQLLLVFLTARSAPLLGFVSFVAAAGAICGVVRVRTLVVVAVVLAVGWPTLFHLRNEVRQDGGVTVSQQAGDRLRLDLQMSAVAGHDVPVDLPQPDAWDYLRYGTVPRLLDGDRPTIATSVEINQYLGGGDTSAYNFLALGTVYFLDGPLAVVVFYALWSLLVVALLRAGGSPGPTRLAVLCFALAGPLLWTSTYPDSMIAFIQHAVSAVPVLVLLHVTARRAGRADVRPPQPGVGSPRRPVLAEAVRRGA